VRRFHAFLLAAIALAPIAAGAADVPVVYTVDTTALKLAVSGTPLTFELHTNATCTALAHTQVLTIDATNMQSVLKRSKPKNGVKPPKTTDIRATLTGVSPAAPLYAKVTGTGITPVGGPCQVQAATAGGSTGGDLVIKDSNGTVMGPFDISGTFVLDDAGVPVLTSAPPSGFTQGLSLYYTSTDCSGSPVLFATSTAGGYLRQAAGVYGTDLYYFPITGTPDTANSQEFRPEIAANCAFPGAIFTPPDRCCCSAPTCFQFPFNSLFAAPDQMDISGFVPPFSVSIQ
jgi:hypothetical protein